MNNKNVIKQFLENYQSTGFSGELEQTLKEVVLHLAWLLTCNVHMCLY